MTPLRLAGAAVGALTVVFALAPLVRGGEELPTAQHHLLHAALIVGAVVSGLLWSPAPARSRRGSLAALLVAVLAPILAMFLMWPSDYAYLDRHPGGHAVEHLGLVVLAFASAYWGQRFAPVIGWAMAGGLVVMSLLAPLGFGVSPGPAAIAAVATPPPSTTTESTGRGAALYAQNCAGCHGASGQGGVGPSLKDERARKNLAQSVAWIENPAPPMPKLYPSTLSEQDVRAVAAFVQRL